MVPKPRRLPTSGARGKLGSLQKIAVASGLLNGHSSKEIAATTGLAETSIPTIVKADPYIGHLVGRLIMEHETEIKECFTLMLYTIQRDLQSPESPIVTAARKDLTRVMALSAQTDKDTPPPVGQVNQLVINLPTGLPAIPAQIAHSSKR